MNKGSLYLVRNLAVKAVAALLLLSHLSLTASADMSMLTPPVGPKLRQNILDVLRVRLEAEARVKIKLVVKIILASGDEARACVVPQNLDGSKLDMQKSILKDVYKSMKSGEIDGIETGLEGSASKLVRTNGRWFEVEWVGGATVCDK